MNEFESVSRIPTEEEVKKMSDKEFDEYCSKITKELVKSFGEVGEYEDY